MSKINTLYERLLNFTHSVIQLCSKLPRNIEANIISKQIIRSSSSVGANFSESLEASTARDRSFKINISRKEVKETLYWLDLVIIEFPQIDVNEIREESIELAKILATIQRKIDT